jgi:hypothetical protein
LQTETRKDTLGAVEVERVTERKEICVAGAGDRSFKADVPMTMRKPAAAARSSARYAREIRSVLFSISNCDKGLEERTRRDGDTRFGPVLGENASGTVKKQPRDIATAELARELRRCGLREEIGLLCRKLQSRYERGNNTQTHQPEQFHWRFQS